MPRYIITERAGRFVAGHTNTGVGTALDLTERAAAHEVRLGTLKPAPGATQEQAAPAPAPVVELALAVEEPTPAPEPDDDQDDEQPAKKRRRGKSKAE